MFRKWENHVRRFNQKNKKRNIVLDSSNKNKATRKKKRNVVLNGSNKKQSKFVLDDPTMQYDKDKDTSF